MSAISVRPTEGAAYFTVANAGRTDASTSCDATCAHQSLLFTTNGSARYAALCNASYLKRCAGLAFCKRYYCCEVVARCACLRLWKLRWIVDESDVPDGEALMEDYEEE